MIIIQNKQPILFKHPSNRNSNIYPKALITQPHIPNIINKRIANNIIPIASIFMLLTNINIELILKKFNIV